MPCILPIRKGLLIFPILFQRHLLRRDCRSMRIWCRTLRSWASKIQLIILFCQILLQLPDSTIHRKEFLMNIMEKLTGFPDPQCRDMTHFSWKQERKIWLWRVFCFWATEVIWHIWSHQRAEVRAISTICLTQSQRKQGCSWKQLVVSWQNATAEMLMWPTGWSVMK